MTPQKKAKPRATAKGEKRDKKPMGHKPKEGQSDSSDFKLDSKVLVRIHDLMVKARETEERQIKMYKQADGFFWIGGPGEEALGVPLGMMVKKGHGIDHDYLHMHYRGCPVVIAMGGDPKDTFRQMKNTATDPYSGGRNFSNHFSIKKWNIVPVASTIETQFQSAIGTAIAQAQKAKDSITIVTGGDAGSAEAEFASALIWASRPALPLPMLMICTNNDWGISTDTTTQMKKGVIAKRAQAFGIETLSINGNDVEESWFALEKAMNYVRKECKPFLIEAQVSRLHGHSSATGANYKKGEVDCLVEFQKKLIAAGIITQKQIDEIQHHYHDDFKKMSQQVRDEPQPDPDTIYDHTYHGQKGKYW